MAEVRARDLRFHVQQLGDGTPTVVFLHGLVMDNLSSWYFTVANHVAKHARVVCLDLRGHGRTERPLTGYRVEDMVADVHGVLDALQVREPVCLVGNSFGGLLALAFAATHPNRTAGLVLVDAHLSDGGWGAQMGETLGLQGAERDQVIAETFQHWLGRHSARKRNKLARTAEALVYGTSLVEDLKQSAPMTDDLLGRIQCPVLALYGEESDVGEHGERLGRRIPKCTLRWLPSCSHSVLWEATDVVRDAVVGWVTTHRDTGGDA